jgi:polysaccharide export outer membrane protein
VTAYNSKNYYIQGAVRIPGRLPVTGSDTVLDAITYAGGLTERADHDRVILYRPQPPGVNAPLQRLPVNIDQITMGDDPTTNYQMLPGDRLVVPAKPGSESEADDPRAGQPSASSRERSEAPRLLNRRPPVVRSESADVGDSRRDDRPDRGPTLRDLERRLGEVERKLDRVLDALERRGP